MAYNELVQRHKELLQDPARLLETEEGQQVIEEAKEEIVEPIYKAIDEMMREHWL